MSDRINPTRRELITLGIGAFAFAAVPLARRDRRRITRRTLPVMGTLAEVAVVHADERWAARAIDAALDELRTVDATMSRFRADSDIGRVNAHAARGAVAIGAGTAIVVDEALRWAAATSGRFDPALARVSELWDDGARRSAPPLAEARRYARRGLYRSIERGTSGGRHVVVFHDADAALDLGAIAKGFAVDRAVGALRDWGITSALVNAGGDLYALGRAADGEPWRIGVRDPNGDGVIATLDVSDEAVATSGDYERVYTVAGRRFHHLLDPATGEPRVCPTRSLTIAGPRCIDADAGATAVFGAPAAQARAIHAVAAPDLRIVHSVEEGIA